MNSKNKYSIYKYKLLEVLQTKYPMDEYMALKKEIPEMLNVSIRTFNNWLYMRKESKNTIRYVELYKLSKILNTTVEDLLNFEIDFEVVKPNKN